MEYAPKSSFCVRFLEGFRGSTNNFAVSIFYCICGSCKKLCNYRFFSPYLALIIFIFCSNCDQDQSYYYHIRNKRCGLFLWMRFNCLIATEPLQGGVDYHSVLRSPWYSIDQPRKDERLGRLWSHPVVSDLGLVDWESSALTTRPLHHVCFQVMSLITMTRWWSGFKRSLHKLKSKISPTYVPLATKFGRMVTYFLWLLPIKPRDALITWSWRRNVSS